jgi:hypothetical protein
MDDIATRRTERSEKCYIDDILADTYLEEIIWSPHPIDGWVGSYHNEARIMERLTSDGYYWGYPSDDFAYFLPQAACPDDFAALYEAIIASQI